MPLQNAIYGLEAIPYEGDPAEVLDSPLTNDGDPLEASTTTGSQQSSDRGNLLNPFAQSQSGRPSDSTGSDEPFMLFSAESFQTRAPLGIPGTSAMNVLSSDSYHLSGQMYSSITSGYPPVCPGSPKKLGTISNSRSPLVELSPGANTRIKICERMQIAIRYLSAMVAATTRCVGTAIQSAVSFARNSGILSAPPLEPEEARIL
ncbi:hypothetical protein OPQ81_010703 [Rhizoctonia solani]|nr:hypothetical protein OPQ81_010703 [Rhizoctonia solani]